MSTVNISAEVALIEAQATRDFQRDRCLILMQALQASEADNKALRERIAELGAQAETKTED